MSIPNSFPDKEALINELEAKEISLKEAQKEKQQQSFAMAQRIKAPVQQQPVPENEKYGGLTEEEIKEAEELIDPEGVADMAAGQISKKGYWSQIKRACMLADVVI